MHFSRLAKVVSLVGAGVVVGVWGCTPPADIVVDGGTSADGGGGSDAGPAGVPNHYVLNQLTMPTNNNQARQYGLDLNGDGVVDNQFGTLSGSLAGQGFDVTGSQTAIDTGLINVLLNVITPDFTAASSAKVRVLIGANPMPMPCVSDGGVDAGLTCGQHLKGTGSFTFVPRMPEPAALVGSIVSGVLNVGPGDLSLGVSLLGAQPVLLHLQNARIRLSGITDGGVSNGIIAGGISESELDVTVYPGLQTSYAALIARECNMLGSPPACGCLSGSTGKTVLELFDAPPKNCQLSVAEIKGNSLIQSLLAADLVPDGGAADGGGLLSFGVGISAVRGAYMVGGE